MAVVTRWPCRSMAGMESTLSIIATIISSVALIGVALGLVLQSRQLRTSQIQAMRGMHLELIKIGLDNPALASSIFETVNAEDLPAGIMLNLHMIFWATSYSLKTLNRAALASQMKAFFSLERARTWWGDGVREAYEIQATTKLDKDFFVVVDGVFQDVMNSLQAGSSTDANVSGGKE